MGCNVFHKNSLMLIDEIMYLEPHSVQIWNRIKDSRAL